MIILAFVNNAAKRKQMGNAPPVGSVELKIKFSPKHKNERLFVLIKSDTIVANEMNTTYEATLFTSKREQISCLAKVVQKNDPETKILQLLLAEHEKKYGKAEYPSFMVPMFGIAEDSIFNIIVVEKAKCSLFKLLYFDKFKSHRLAMTMQDKEKLALSCLNCVMQMNKLNIVHRGIKPTQFLVSENLKTVTLCGFGSSLALFAQQGDQLKQFGGAVQYMSPERCTLDEKFSLTDAEWIASDLYSVGIVICEIISGSMPFDGNIDAEKLFHERVTNNQLMPFYKFPTVSCKLVQHTLLARDTKCRNPQPFVEYVTDQSLNSLPNGWHSVKHVFYPKFRNEHMFVQVLDETINTGQVPVAKGILYISTYELPCAAKTILKTDPEGSVILKLFSNYKQKFGNDSYPDFAVTIYGMVEESSSYTIVMEQMAGSLLDALYSDIFENVRNTWKAENWLLFSLQCLKCLQKLHQLGVAHRDIKPGNFLVSSDIADVKLCDFGSIKDMQSGVTTHNLKQFGGTLPYMAPERITLKSNFKLTPEQWIASDLYSVGVVMCEIMSGLRPFGVVDYDPDAFFLERLQDTTKQPFAPFTDNPFCACVQQFLLCHDASKRDATPVLEFFESQLPKQKGSATMVKTETPD